MSAGGGAARHDEGSQPFNGTGGTARNAAQASLFLLEPTADAAMTYFYGQLFAMDTEIRAMFPAAMDVQRGRFFRALAGGTGLAPIKAIIEAITHAPAPGRRREVVLYFGVRRHQDLYDLAD